MWTYNDKLYDTTPEDYQGFVYIITEFDTGKKYIGKKNFWRPKILPKNSKRARRVRTRVESDWKIYYGSNKEIQALVESKGQEEKSSDFVKQKEKCPTLRQRLNSIITYFFPTSGTTSL